MNCFGVFVPYSTNIKYQLKFDLLELFYWNYNHFSHNVRNNTPEAARP